MITRVDYLELSRPSSGPRDENPPAVKFTRINNKISLEVKGSGSFTVDEEELRKVFEFVFLDKKNDRS